MADLLPRVDSPDGAGSRRRRRDGTPRDGAHPNGAARDGAAQDGAHPNGAARDGAARDGVERDGAWVDEAAVRALAPSGPAQELAAQFAAVARALAAEPTVDRTLARLVGLAVQIIPGCHHAGVTVVRRGRPETPAATDEVPVAVDAIQYETGQGPCLSAISEQAVFRVSDLATDGRWPAFARPAVERTGVRSVLAYRLFTDQDTFGALNLYSRERDAFPDEAVPVGTVLAAHAALAYALAREREQVSGLEQALGSNRTIAMAIGILMATHQIKEQEAFDRLRVVSQRSNTRLRDLADEVVRTGVLPGPPRRG